MQSNLRVLIEVNIYDQCGCQLFFKYLYWSSLSHLVKGLACYRWTWYEDSY